MVTVSERPLNNSASIWIVVLSTRPTTSGARTTVGAGEGATSFSHWQSMGRASLRSARKTGWRREFSCVHPLNLTRAAKTGETQDGLSLVSGTVSNGQAGAASSFNLLLNSFSFFASNPLPTCPMNRSFLPSYKPNNNEPKGRAEVRASVQPPTTASTVLALFSFTQYGLRSETYGLSARFATIPSNPFCSASVNNSFPCSS